MSFRDEVMKEVGDKSTSQHKAKAVELVEKLNKAKARQKEIDEAHRLLEEHLDAPTEESFEPARLAIAKL